jgi:hypothetical protein
MPRTQVTFGQLKALRDDILFLQNQSPAFYFFNTARVERFNSQNSMALKLLESRLDEFVKKYVKMDADLQPVTEEKDGRKVYCFYSDEYRENYLKALNNFLSQKISLDL